jgi:hypothetical protein
VTVSSPLIRSGNPTDSEAKKREQKKERRGAMRNLFTIPAGLQERGISFSLILLLSAVFLSDQG